MTTTMTMTMSTLPVTADRTRALLWAGAAAGPLWAAVSLTQAALRDGFDITRHPLSLLANGDLGWLQIGNFLVAGALIVASATGLAHALRAAPGGRWAPHLVRATGIGMILSGFLVMDPGNGFPADVPTSPAVLSWHGIGHMAAGAISFTALIAACFVLGHHYSRTRRHGMAITSRLAGTALLVADVWAMTGGRAGSLTLAVGVITAMLWASAVSAALAVTTTPASPCAPKTTALNETA